MWPGFFLKLPGQVGPLGLYLRWLGALLEGALLWGLLAPTVIATVRCLVVGALVWGANWLEVLPPTRMACFYELRVRWVSVPRVGAWCGWPDPRLVGTGSDYFSDYLWQVPRIILSP